MSLNYLIGTNERRETLNKRFYEDLNPFGSLNPFRQAYRNTEDTCYQVKATVSVALTALALYGANLVYLAAIEHPVSASALAAGVAYSGYKMSQQKGGGPQTFTVCVNGVDMKFPLIVREEVMQILQNSNEKAVQDMVDSATDKIKQQILNKVGSVNIKVKNTAKGGKRKTLRRTK